MEELVQVYTRSLFQVAKERGLVDKIKEELEQFADAVASNPDMATFFFSPYFSTDEKQGALKTAVVDATPELYNFLSLLIENRRAPLIERVRQQYTRLWAEDNQVLPVKLTSAIQLSEETVSSVGKSIGKSTGKKIELESEVDPEIIGGVVLRVGNAVLDASIRRRLEKFKQAVA